MRIHFGQSTYFRANGGIDRYFLETYLLPGLETQGEIASGSLGIALPVGENQEPEYLALDEAKALVLDWLEQSNNLLTSDKQKLTKVKSYKQFADLASNIYQSKVRDPNKLLTATRLQNIAELRAKKLASTTPATPRFDPGKAIDDYNRLYLKLLSSSRTGIPHNLLQQIVSPGIPSGAGNMREAALASVISAHLSRLHAAGSVGSSKDAQDNAVAQELGNIIKTSYPQMTGLLNILGEPQTASGLREITTRLTQELTEDNVSISAYDKIQVEASRAADNYVPSPSELRTQIYNELPLINNEQRDLFTNLLMREMVRSASHPLSSEELLARLSNATIVYQDGKREQISPSELAIIQKQLEGSGLTTALEYRQNELAILVDSNHLSLGERGLLNNGINPFLTHHSPETLVALESKLLAEYNAIPGHSKQFIMLSEAYQNERQSDRPNTLFLEKTRSHFDSMDTYRHLSLTERAQVRRAGFTRWIEDTRSRAYETQAKFFDKWIDIEDTITGKKAFNKLLDSWEVIAEKVTIPGTHIPLFRIGPWLYEQVELWKKASTLNLLSRTSGSTNWLGRTANWTLKQYELGEFSVNGAIAQFSTRQWGKMVKWSLAKTGMSGVVKYAGVSTARTATRLLISIGGKALARLGAKAIGALITAATAVGTIIFAVGMVWDLISIGWEFLKEFIHNVDFRNKVIKWGTAIWAGITAINFVGILTSLGVLLGAPFIELLLALAIVGGIIFTLPQILNTVNTNIQLDSNSGALPDLVNFGAVNCMPGSPPVPLAPAGSNITQKSFEIVSNLYQGFWCYWNRPANPQKSQQYILIFKEIDTIKYPKSNYPFLFNYEQFIANPNPAEGGQNLFWCTQLAEKSYELAGNSFVPHELRSDNMKAQFAGRGTFIAAGAASQNNVKPGAVIFFHVEGGPDRTNHVGVVNTVSAGGITYYQSNAGVRIGSISFTNNGVGLDSAPGIITEGIGNP